MFFLLSSKLSLYYLLCFLVVVFTGTSFKLLCVERVLRSCHSSSSSYAKPDHAKSGVSCRGAKIKSGKQPQTDLGSPSNQDLEDKINVVLTHTTADFDSLAAAVGLAKLWQDEIVGQKCFVCLPRGSHPTVAHFLALHKYLFPVISLKDIVAGKLYRVGLVDAQTRDRIGPAESLLDMASEIHIYDHHAEKKTDIPATNVIIEKVGSVTTIIVELLQKRQLVLKESEATLLALGIHSDTGSFTFESTTSRDIRALAWLIDQGASQKAISEYGHTSLTSDQQAVLSDAYTKLEKKFYNGMTIGSALVDCKCYIRGMAVVAQNILEISDCDVVLLAVRYPNRRGKKPNSLALIGRANARAQDLNWNKLLSPHGGGGHPKASSANLRLDHEEDMRKFPIVNGMFASAEDIVCYLIDKVCSEQIKNEGTAIDIMTAPVLTCLPSDLINSVAKTLERCDIHALPVCTEDKTLLGMININAARKAQRMNEGDIPVSGKMVKQLITATTDQSIAEIEELLVSNDIGSIPVVEGGKIVGIITRTDLLRQHHYYNGLHYHNKAFAHTLDSPGRKMIYALRKKLKRFDKD